MTPPSTTCNSLSAVAALCIACLLAPVPGASAADACNKTQCSSTSICTGFAQEVCTNSSTNGTYTVACYMAKHCVAYVQVDGDISLTMMNAPPDKINGLYGIIRSTLMRLYNDFCRAGENYKLCCPNSIAWPNKASESATKTAMSSAATEVEILSAYGAAASTTLAIRLSPSSTSQLCTAVTYPTTVAAATTKAATAAASTAAPATATAAATAAGTGSPGTSGPTQMMTSSPAAMASSPMTSPPGAMASSPMTSPPGAMASSPMTSPPGAMASSPMTSPPGAMASSPMTSPPGAMASTPMSSPPATMGSTPNSPPMTSMMATSMAPNGTSSGKRRRRRDLHDLSDVGSVDASSVVEAEERGGSFDDDDTLSRERRATAGAISLPSSTISSLTNNMNISQEIQVALSGNVSVVVSVSVASTAGTTVGVTATTVKSAAMAVMQSNVSWMGHLTCCTLLLVLINKLVLL